MAMVFDRPGKGPGTHALIVGVNDRTTPGAAPFSAAVSAEKIADWLLSMGIIGAPLSSVCMLASEAASNKGVYHNKRDRTLVRLSQPRIQAFEKALSEWRDRLDTDRGNVGIFYFVGPTLESGSNINLILQGSGGDLSSAPVDFPNLWSGMKGAAAERQLFFVDGCRSVFEKGRSPPGARLFASGPSELGRRAHAWYFGRTPEGPAKGSLGRPGCLTEALLSIVSGSLRPFSARLLATTLDERFGKALQQAGFGMGHVFSHVEVDFELRFESVATGGVGAKRKAGAATSAPPAVPMPPSASERKKPRPGRAGARKPDQAQENRATSGRPAKPISVDARIAGLTAAQRDSLGYVRQGLSSREIAELLGLKRSTVDHYISRAIRALGVGDRWTAAQMVAEPEGDAPLAPGATSRAGLSRRGADEEAAHTHFVSDDPEVERDELDRGPLAVALARRLHRIWCRTNGISVPGSSAGLAPPAGGDTPAAFVLHLDAPWGGGKTSFANFLARALNPFPAGRDRVPDFLTTRAGETKRVGTIFIQDPPALDEGASADTGGAGATDESPAQGQQAAEIPPASSIGDHTREQNGGRPNAVPGRTADRDAEPPKDEASAPPIEEVVDEDAPAGDEKVPQSWSENARRPWITVTFNAWQAEHCSPPWWVFYQAIRKGCFDSIWKEGDLPSASDAEGPPTRPGWWPRVVRWAGLWRRELWWRLRNPKVKILLITAAVSLLLLVGLSFAGVISVNDKGGVGFGTGDALGIALAAITSIGAFWGVGALLTESIIPGTASATERLSLGGGDPFERFRGHFNKTMTALRRPVMVIVDDLDRCRPDFVVDLVRGIQTLLRSPRVVFVILGDRDWIERAFESHHQEMRTVNVGAEQTFGARFVEKAIQMSFLLPEVPAKRQGPYVRGVLLGAGAGDTKPAERPVVTPAIASELREAFKARVATATSVESRGEAREALSTAFQNRIKASVPKDEKLDEKAVTEQVEKVLGEESAVMAAVDERMGEALLHQLEPLAPFFPPNPRQIKRIVNAISMYTCVAYLRGDLKEGEARVVELAIWVILMTEWPATWRLLASCPDLVAAITAQSVEGARQALRKIDPTELPGSAELTLEEIMRIRADARLRALIKGGGPTGAPALSLASVREFRSLTPLYAGKRKLGGGAGDARAAGGADGAGGA